LPLKKSELYSAIWKSCDELRGGMDASQYKDYVLVLLFIKYVSDKYANDPTGLIQVPNGGSFKDLVALKGQKDIGDKINKILGKLAEANELKGIIDIADFNDEDKLGKGKEMQDRLSNLIAIFETPYLDFSKNRAEGDDLLGDAYEYLMRNFATESGKSKGQFYTPAEVSRVIAKIIGIKPTSGKKTTVYDPTCGSGSLLLKVADESEKGVTLYGQEKDVATAALAKMNMILHNNEDADIQKGQSTLSNPIFINENKSLKTFDFAVSNPPFSYKSWLTGLDPWNDQYERFKDYGIPPKKNGDYAFLLHVIKSLTSKGKGAIILPHGVLFRGNAEAEIRKNIIRKGFIKGIIGLPANLFYGTGIPACILIIDKENAEARKGVFMVDASKGFEKDGNKNRLRHQDLHKIVDVFNNQIELPKYSRMISINEIEKNEFNLNIPRYIDSQEEEDIQDIEAHLMGGLPNRDIEVLNNYWQVYPTLKKTLFKATNRNGYSILKIENAEIKNKIFNHPEFLNYSSKIHLVFDAWRKRNSAILKKISIGVKPKKLIADISEDILSAFSDIRLIDKYDIYQNLMTYWNSEMQDDIYLISSEGWKAEFIYSDDLGEYECDLLPKQIVINSFFQEEKLAIEQLELDREIIARQMEELVEEQSHEENLFEAVKTDKGKVTKVLINKRIKEIEKQYLEVKTSQAAEPKVSYLTNIDRDMIEQDELVLLKVYLALFEEDLEKNKVIKKAHKELETKLIAKYEALNEDELKKLVINEKWMAAIFNDVKSEMDRISHNLTQRIKDLAERYQTPLPEINKEVSELEKKVNKHLKKMGFVWN